jgi:hypothetical protein
MICPDCGMGNLPGARTCSACGAFLPTEEPPYIPPRTSGLAIASFVLGLVGLACGLTALPGLILGIVALVTIRRRPSELTGRGLAIAGIATSAFFLLVYIAATVGYAVLISRGVFPFMRRFGGEMRTGIAESAMREVARGIRSYQLNNDGALPETLEELAPAYLDAQQVFVMPRAFLGAQTGKPPDVLYRYVGPLPAGTPDSVVVCYTARGLIEGKRCVLTLGGETRWMPEDGEGNAAAAAAGALQLSYEAVVQTYKDELAPERDAQLRDFYEVTQ